MKKSRFFFGIFLFTLLFQNCSKDLPAPYKNVDYFGFSIYFCECFGDCSDVYKLEENRLYRRENGSCIVNDFNFKDVELSSEKRDLARELQAIIPDELLDSNEEIFGCPDCGDWGGHIIELKKGEKDYAWNIDNRKEDLPQWLLPFKEKLDSSLVKLQQ